MLSDAFGTASTDAEQMLMSSLHSRSGSAAKAGPTSQFQTFSGPPHAASCSIAAESDDDAVIAPRSSWALTVGDDDACIPDTYTGGT